MERTNEIAVEIRRLKQRLDALEQAPTFENTLWRLYFAGKLPLKQVDALIAAYRLERPAPSSTDRKQTGEG